MATRAPKVYSRVALLGAFGALVIIVTMSIWDYSSRYFFYQSHIRKDLTNLSEAIAFDVSRGFIVHKVLSVSAAAANLDYVHVYSANGPRIASYPSTLLECTRDIIEAQIEYAGSVVGKIVGCPSRERFDFSYGVVVSALMIMLVYLALFMSALRTSAYEDGIAFSIDKISHEVRKPLSISKMVLESLIHEKRFDDFQRKREQYVQLVQQSFSNAELILRNFDSIKSTWKPNFIDISVQGLLEASLGEYHTDPRLKRLETMVLDDVMLQVDIHQIKLVVSNIVKNAIEANCSEIKVHAAIYSGRLRIDISNNGDPIDRKTIKKIFKRYYTTKATGTGIGLEISRDLLLKQGGDIQAKSSNGWTTFEIYLPFVSSYQKAPFDKECASLQKLNVFVVDDEVDYQDYLIRMIGEKGEVHRFRSGAGLLEMVTSTPPDLVFMDIDLNQTHENGLTLCRKLRKLNRDLCIILHSHDSSSSLNLAEVGANLFIAKPMYGPILDNVLKNLMIDKSSDRRSRSTGIANA